MIIKRGECFNHHLLKEGMTVRCLASYHENYEVGKEYFLTPGFANKFAIQNSRYTGESADWLVVDLAEPKSVEELL